MLRALALVCLCLVLPACGDDGGGGTPDAGGSDARPPDAAPPDADDGSYWLSETGLYDDIGTKVIAADAVEFEPAYVLWSDTAAKRRWVILPQGTTIDTTSMDHWEMPVGTRFFKEFRRDGVLVETRLIERLGPGSAESDWFMGAFIWLPDESDARFEALGATDVLGTEHDVPAATKCWTCHGGEPGHILGFSAIQLSHDGPGINLQMLAQGGWLSSPPTGTYPLPGDAATQKALGTLHANCGHCHNPNGTAWPDTQMILRYDVAETAMPVDQSQLYLTTVDEMLQYWTDPVITHRIVPGDSSMSAISVRMGIRDGSLDQMPPIATELVDPTGLADVSSWIDSL